MLTLVNLVKGCPLKEFGSLIVSPLQLSSFDLIVSILLSKKYENSDARARLSVFGNDRSCFRFRAELTISNIALELPLFILTLLARSFALRSFSNAL